jgi:hypothetical protein
MRQRLKSLQRVLSVQKDMRRLAEWRFVKIERHLQMLRAEQERLLAHLDSEQLFATAFAKPILERLRALEEAKARLTREREEQRQLLLEDARRMGQVTNLTEAVEERCRREDEKRELDAAIEAALNRAAASFR